MNLKTTTLVLASLVAATAILGGLATASHAPHGPCGYSTLSVGNSVRADVWANNACAGATVYSAFVACGIGGHWDLLLTGTHVQYLDSGGCETGAIQELP